MSNNITSAAALKLKLPTIFIYQARSFDVGSMRRWRMPTDVEINPNVIDMQI